jgi:hypothetical protein
VLVEQRLHFRGGERAGLDGAQDQPWLDRQHEAGAEHDD